MTIAEEKTALRAQILAARDTVSPEARAQKSATICHELIEMSQGVRHFDSSEQAGATDARAEAQPSAAASPIIAVYGAMKSEVDLDAFIREAYARGWRVAFPCMVHRPGASLRTFADRPAQQMTFLQVPVEAYNAADSTFIAHPLKSYSLGDGAIAAFPVCAPEEIDFAVVPLVAFDSQNNRLGYGGGNYDRFLPKLRPATPICGVGFEEQRIDAVPLEEHDQPLPCILSA